MNQLQVLSQKIFIYRLITLIKAQQKDREHLPVFLC